MEYGRYNFFNNCISKRVYMVDVTFDCGVFSDTAEIVFNSDSTTYTATELLICTDELPASLVASGLYDSYLWSTGETTPEIMITEPGTYYVLGYTGCATYIDTFSVVIYEEISDVPLPDTHPDL
jgi:hypothetical protein